MVCGRVEGIVCQGKRKDCDEQSEIIGILLGIACKRIKGKNNSENKEKMFAVKRAYQKWCARYCIMQ